MTSLHETLRGIIIRMIQNEPDPAEQKARILIARQHGHFTDQEAEDWIRLLELKAA